MTPNHRPSPAAVPPSIDLLRKLDEQPPWRAGEPSRGDPSFDVDAARFIGANLKLFEADVLVIQVAPRILGDRCEAPALVAAFAARFRRTIVLVAQDARGLPTYFGPAAIAAALAKLPFDALPWRRYRYRPPRPKMLPIPIDPLPSFTSDEQWASAPASASAGQPSWPDHDEPEAPVPTRDLRHGDHGRERERRTRTLPPR